jgi:hypothetical protein
MHTADLAQISVYWGLCLTVSPFACFCRACCAPLSLIPAESFRARSALKQVAGSSLSSNQKVHFAIIFAFPRTYLKRDYTSKHICLLPVCVKPASIYPCCRMKYYAFWLYPEINSCLQLTHFWFVFLLQTCHEYQAGFPLRCLQNYVLCGVLFMRITVCACHWSVSVCFHFRPAVVVFLLLTTFPGGVRAEILFLKKYGAEDFPGMEQGRCACMGRRFHRSRWGPKVVQQWYEWARSFTCPKTGLAGLRSQYWSITTSTG